MTEERARIYDNARTLADRLMSDGEAETADPTMVFTIAESIAALLAALRETDDIVLPECPALERWRQSTLEERGADPLAVAAAWEVTAVQCDQSGAYDLAQRCRSNAVYALKPRRAA